MEAGHPAQETSSVRHVFSLSLFTQIYFLSQRITDVNFNMLNYPETQLASLPQENGCKYKWPQTKRFIEVSLSHTQKPPQHSERDVVQLPEGIMEAEVLFPQKRDNNSYSGPHMY